jgi:hypothetical protein
VLDASHDAMQLNQQGSIMRLMSWRALPISPYPMAVYANGGIPPPGVTQGHDGLQLPKASPALGPTKWVQGGTAEVGLRLG